MRAPPLAPPLAPALAPTGVRACPPCSPLERSRRDAGTGQGWPTRAMGSRVDRALDRIRLSGAQAASRPASNLISSARCRSLSGVVDDFYGHRLPQSMDFATSARSGGRLSAGQADGQVATTEWCSSNCGSARRRRRPRSNPGPHGHLRGQVPRRQWRLDRSADRVPGRDGSQGDSGQTRAPLRTDPRGH